MATNKPNKTNRKEKQHETDDSDDYDSDVEMIVTNKKRKKQHTTTSTTTTTTSSSSRSSQSVQQKGKAIGSEHTLADLEKHAPGVFKLKPKDSSKVSCTLCKYDLVISSGVKDILRHLQTEKHKASVKGNIGQRSLFTMGISTTTMPDQMVRFQEGVLQSEILLSQYIAKSNSSFHSSTELVKLLKHIAPDSKIVQALTCAATKCTQVAKTIGGHYIDEVMAHLQAHPFSLMIDESNSRQDKVLGIMARYYDVNLSRSRTVFVTLLECLAGTAAHIFNLLDTFFSENNIPWGNVMSFESDNCNVMKGKHKGVIALIRKKNASVMDLGCICHLTNLCNVAAMKSLPMSVDDLLVDIFYHFDKSSKRVEEFKTYFSFHDDLEYSAIIKHCPTRWLSMRPCITRLINHYQPFLGYFRDHPDRNKGKVKAILETLSDVQTLPILLFLEDVLPAVDAYNKVFQSEKHIIDCAHSTTESLMRKLLGRVMAPEDVIQVLETKVMDEDVAFLPPNDRDIGEKCRIAIAGLGDDQSPDTIAAIIQSCTDWIQKFVEKMIKTLPFKQMLLFSRLYPPTLSKTSVSDFMRLLEYVAGDVIIEKLDAAQLKDEVRVLICTRYRDEDTQLPTDEFFAIACTDKPLLTSLLPYLLSTPNSNSATERLFSLLKAVHTEARNRLNLDSINSILSIKVNKLSPIHEADLPKSVIKRCKQSTKAYNDAHKSQ